jgi:hypothetical protein
MEKLAGEKNHTSRRDDEITIIVRRDRPLRMYSPSPGLSVQLEYETSSPSLKRLG